MAKETVEIDKSTLKNWGIGLLAVLLVVAIFTGGFGIAKKDTGKAVANPDNGNAAPTVNMKDLLDDDAVLGDPNAPVTIVEFSDYECPFCQRFYVQTFGQIKENYIDTGKVKLIYRDFPLSFHEHAEKAAEAAECAGEQGKYYEMGDKLFSEGVDGGVDSFKQYAVDLGLDTDAFNTCLDSGQMASEIQKDMVAGQKAGVQGTPSFFIDGEMITGAQPYSVFEDAIEKALAA